MSGIELLCINRKTYSTNFWWHILYLSLSWRWECCNSDSQRLLVPNEKIQTGTKVFQISPILLITDLWSMNSHDKKCLISYILQNNIKIPEIRKVLSKFWKLHFWPYKKIKCKHLSSFVQMLKCMIWVYNVHRYLKNVFWKL